MNLLNILIKLFAGHGVQGGKRLVHQQNAGAGSQGAGKRHALLHSAGKFMNMSMGTLFQPHQFQILLRHGKPVSPSQSGHQIQAEHHVPHHIQPRKQGGLLEHHSSVPSGSRHRLPVQLHHPGRRKLQPCNDIQQGSLPAAAGPHQAHELASSDIQINALQSHHLSAPPVKHLAHAGNTELAASGAAMFCTRNHLPPASFAMVNCSSAASGTTRPPISGTSFINPA